MYKIFGNSIIEKLEKKAVESPRRRAHYNLHKSYEDKIQKVLIFLLRGTYIAPHYHKYAYQKELFILLKGKVRFVFFDDKGVVLEVKEINKGEILEIEPLTIHSVIVLSKKALVLEIKEGPFIKEKSKEFKNWAVLEGDSEEKRFLTWLEGAKEGNIYK